MADPLSIVSTIISTASAIHTWFDQHESKNTIIRELRITVRNVYSIVSPLHQEKEACNIALRSATEGYVALHCTPLFPDVQDLPISKFGRTTSEAPSHLPTLECLVDLNDALHRTKEHLMSWLKKGGYRKEFMAKLLPSIALRQLTEDQKWLAQRCQDLQLAFSMTLWRQVFEGRSGSDLDAITVTVAPALTPANDTGMKPTNTAQNVRDHSTRTFH